MAAEHGTLMVLKVDLECYRCFLKVKKVLGNLPQIGDQVFDWNLNEVRISVICCDPEKIRRKLYSKAGKAINNVAIKLPGAKPKSAAKPNDLDKKVVFVKPHKPNSKTDKPKTDDKTKADPPKTPEPAPKPRVNPVPEPLKMPGPVNSYPLQVYPTSVPVAAHCGQCYDGGPGHHGGYARPGPPLNGSFVYGYEHGYGGGKAVDLNRLDYFSEENPSGCSIM